MAKILIVEDRAINREYLVGLLSYSAHCLLVAADAAQALEAARSQHPDLIIADVLTPAVEGYELVRQLRADPSIAGTPVVFYTANDEQREVQPLAWNCGVADAIAKPAQPEWVLDVVNTVLGHGQPVSPAPALPDPGRRHLQPLTDKLPQRSDEPAVTQERLPAAVDMSFELGSQDVLRGLLQSLDADKVEEEPGEARLLLKKLRENHGDLRDAISSLELLAKKGRKRSRSLSLVKDKGLHVMRASSHRARTSARRP